MSGIDILPRDLDPAVSVNPTTGALIIDDGVNVQKATPTQIVDSVAPIASQAEAEAGTDNTKRMTALRVAQAIAAQPIADDVLTNMLLARQYAIASTDDPIDGAIDESDRGSRYYSLTAGTYAEQTQSDAAETAADVIAAANSATAAETAALGVGSFLTLAAGIAGTSNGDIFSVIGETPGIKYYLNNSGVGVLKDTLPSAQLTPYVGGNFDSFLGKSSDTDGALLYRPWSDLATTPTGSIDLTTAANYQLLVGTFTTSLSSRLSSTVVGSAIRFNFLAVATYYGGIGTAFRLRAGVTYVLRGKVITAASIASSGIGFFVSATLPTLGGALAVSPDADGAVWRANGAFVVQNEDAGAARTAAIASGTTSGMAFAAGQDLLMTIECNAAATGATINCYLDGSKQNTAPIVITGFAASGYIYLFGRGTGSSDVVECSLVQAQGAALPFPKYIYIDSASAVTPKLGTQAAPWTTIQEANLDYAGAVNAHEVEYWFKRGASNGIYRGEIIIDPTRTRRARIAAVPGHAVRILPNISIAAGAGGWTNIAASEVWYRPTAWGSVLSDRSGNGGIVEVTASVTQTYGNGVDTHGAGGALTLTGRALYTRRALDLVYTSLARGEYTVHQNGAYPGNTLVRCYDGGDPNTKDWRQYTYSTGITVQGANDTDWNACKIEIEGITIEDAYTYGLYARRCEVEMTRVVVKGTGLLFGIECNEVFGVIRSPYIEATTADNFHSAGGLSSDTSRVIPNLTISCPTLMGAFTSSLGGVGDGFSNHTEHTYNIIGPGRVWGAGKDGISAIWDINVSDIDFRYNFNAGITMAPNETTSIRGDVHGCRFVGNQIGINLNTGANTSSTVAADAQDCYFAGQVRSDVETVGVSGASVSTLLGYNLTMDPVYPVPPSQGHIKQGAGTTVTLTTGVALA
jgi:hypothetical protein